MGKRSRLCALGRRYAGDMHRRQCKFTKSRKLLRHRFLILLLVALHNTHAPIEAPPEYAARYNYTQATRNDYYGQVSFVDSTVANMSAALHAKGLWGNTLFVWTTDNGQCRHHHVDRTPCPSSLRCQKCGVFASSFPRV